MALSLLNTPKVTTKALALMSTFFLLQLVGQALQFSSTGVKLQNVVLSVSYTLAENIFEFQL